MVQTDESGQDQSDQSGGGKKWSDSEYTLEEFADGPEMGKRQREKSSTIPKLLV